MMNGNMGGFGNGAGSFICRGGAFGFPFTSLIILGLAIVIIYLFLKNRKKPAKKDPMLFINDKAPVLDPAEIVRLRYARGEISLEEFQAILKNIQS